MARTPRRGGSRDKSETGLATSVDDMLLSAMERGEESLQTGRFIVTFKEGAVEDGVQALGMRVADAREFEDQAVSMADLGDAEALLLPEVGAAVVSGAAFEAHELSVESGMDAESPILSVDPEYFAFTDQGVEAYLKGFRRAAEVIASDIGLGSDQLSEDEADPLVSGATWGLTACKVPQSSRSGAAIRVAVLDTGMDLGHPDFAGRQFVTRTFVGQPVQDLHSHGTHCIGTACGPKGPPGTTPRYGIAYQSPIFVGKVLTNSGSSVTGSVLAGMNWAIASNCTIISMSLGSRAPVQPAYTSAGRAALSRGLLIIAAAGNNAANTGAPANSPTIMAVASLDRNLAPSSFSNYGKVEIAAPGRDVFSSVPRPTRYGTKSGTSMAAPHVAGCAALWAQTSPSLRGQALWNRLLGSARPLAHPAFRVGRGLVQAPA